MMFFSCWGLSIKNIAPLEGVFNVGNNTINYFVTETFWKIGAVELDLKTKWIVFFVDTKPEIKLMC